jgi:hypothetical protein
MTQFALIEHALIYPHDNANEAIKPTGLSRRWPMPGVNELMPYITSLLLRQYGYFGIT